MQISILGGTGAIGEGLARRIARDTDHALEIGSRDADRASNAATRYLGAIRARGYEADIDGADNEAVAARADVVIVAVPPYSITDAIEGISDVLKPGTIIVSPAVGMRSEDDGMHYHRPSAGSVTALANGVAPEGTPVVGAFHTLPADRLIDLDDPLEMDTVVVADDTDARETIIELANEIDGLRALDGGPISNAAEVESVTPLLINLGRYNAPLDHAGFRVVGDRF